MKYYSVIRRNKLLTPATKWMNLIIIMQNSTSQTKKGAHWVIPSIQNSRRFKVVYGDRKMSVCLEGTACGQEQKGLQTQINFGGERYSHYLDPGDGFMGAHRFQNLSKSML